MILVDAGKVKDVVDTPGDAVKATGGAIADGYHGTVDYVKDNTAGDAAEDVVDGTKKAGSKIAEGAKKIVN